MMQQIVIAFPDHHEQELLLAGVPRVGDRIRLINGTVQTWVVREILWLEADGREEAPSVIVSVAAPVKERK